MVHSVTIKNCRWYNSPQKILISSLILPPKIPDVLITSWVRDLIIEFIGCISSAATESKTLGVEMLGAGNGGGGNTRGSK